MSVLHARSRDKKRTKSKEMKVHGKGLAQFYKNIVEKHLKLKHKRKEEK